MARVVRRLPVPDRSVFLLCDIQERFRTLIHRFPTVVHSAKTLTQAARILDIPVVATEQYPKAFKATVEELQPYLVPNAGDAGAAVFEKMKFSMLEDKVQAHLTQVRPQLDSAILYGIETHVCVQQTALELLDQGKDVYVVVDGVSSQRPGDRTIALQLLSSAGAVLTTTESLLFGLMGTARHPRFKEVSKLLVEHNVNMKKLQPLDHFMQ